MTAAETRDRLRELFYSASRMPEDERDRFVQQVEVEDPDTGVELRSLLAASGPAGALFDRLIDQVHGSGSPAVNGETETLDPRIGGQVSQYEILERIGGGGMGVVYKARHVRMGTFAALKFLPVHMVQDEEAKRRFVQEARAAYALEHPNLCTVFDIGETDDGALFIAMAYYDGETLKDRIQRGPMRLDDALAVATQMADGLAGAHRAGIVHRDIKPANVILTSEGTVKLVDFGIALVAGDNSQLTRPQTTVGTLAYMSPEQAQGFQVDARTDVWALGVVLFEMLTCERPFQSAFPQAMMYEVVNGDPVRLSSLREGIPTPVVDLVDRCLQKDPGGRFQTAAAVLAALHRLSREHGNHSATVQEPPPRSDAKAVHPVRIYLSFRHDRDEDVRLAEAIRDHLTTPHKVFLDRHMTVGARWAATIDEELREADYVIALLSQDALRTEMVLAELELAFRYGGSTTGKPVILPVRLRDTRPLPPPVDAYLASTPCAAWNGEDDTDRILHELRKVVDGGTREFDMATTSPAVQPVSGPREPTIVAAGGRLETPEGTMEPSSAYYVVRPTDAIGMSAIQGQGETITIKGARQMGKSSLLIRLVTKAVELGKQAVYIDFQRLGSSVMRDPETFFPAFCRSITDELDLPDSVDEVWKRPLSEEQRCSIYMERKILKAIDAPLVLAMDEVDRMFDTTYRSDFFGMLRSWHNDRAIKPAFRKLDIALVTSTEPYELIEDLNQSPFNVGEVIELEDFTAAQVADLNERYGLPMTPDQLGRLVATIGGHPYLVRRALYLVATARYEAERLLAESHEDDGPFGDHLRHHLFRLSTGHDLSDAMGQILRSGACDSERLYWRLRGAGLVTRRDRRVVPRCDLYARFFSRHVS